MINWYQYDVLAFASVSLKDREYLYDFIIYEFEQRAHKNAKVNSLFTSIINQRESLMKSISKLEDKFQLIAKKYQIKIEVVWQIAYLSRYGFGSSKYQIKSDLLEQQIGQHFDAIEDETLHAMDNTYRTSCMVENFNSRLAPYLDERKSFKNERLSLIQFGLNHKPFMRSEHDYLVGKNPAQVMSGKDHPHWLEMLGFTTFRLAA